jgi:para-aminobenzoate synthetase component I
VDDGAGGAAPPGRPPAWRGPLVEVERLERRLEDLADGPSGLRAELRAFLDAHGLAGDPGAQSARRHPRGETAVGLLLGAAACARLAGLPEGRATPAPAVPDVVAVALRRTPARGSTPSRGPAGVPGEWVRSWTDEEHAAAVKQVRSVIADGGVYQANVVGHRSAPVTGDPLAVAHRVTALAGAAYGGAVAGDGWAVASASPEQLVRVVGSRVTTVPVKGTRRDRPGAREALRRSEKDRAEHVMIVDLERNDLGRVAVTGSVQVDSLYDVRPWSGLWHAGSTVSAELAAGVDLVDLLEAVAPGGSVTGAPKRAACALLAGLEPVGRGPSMGAFGLVWPGGCDLGLTIRTVAVADGRAHVWAGGGVTWGSSPQEEVAEAHDKAGPVLAALQRA